MYANHPDIAARWSREYPNQRDLPRHVAQPKAKSRKRKLAERIVASKE